jgi:AAA15 family ATPase/GTPase
VEAFAKISTDSQIIFSLHDPSLMSNAELRRDEYYFTEKDDQAVTSIFSLSDFSVRRNVPIYDEYIQGRFGAIPFIKDGFVQ